MLSSHASEISSAQARISSILAKFSEVQARQKLAGASLKKLKGREIL